MKVFAFFSLSISIILIIILVKLDNFIFNIISIPL